MILNRAQNRLNETTTTLKIDLHKDKVGDKHIEYYNCKRPFTVDGYDKTSKAVYLFQGCLLPTPVDQQLFRQWPRDS